MARYVLLRIAVIGAGVSGIASAAHLLAEGLDVTVFERASVPGGVWVLDKRRALEPAYPSIAASAAEFAFHPSNVTNDEAIVHSSPGPCYEGLKNNVPTELLELSINQWKPNTPPFTTHDKILEYLQDTAIQTGINSRISYNTRVDTVLRGLNEEKWTAFDAVVVASGHYHAPHVPDIPGLAAWKAAYPDRIQHSKRYRNPDEFREKDTVLLIGGSTSSTDIAKELGPRVKKIWQSTRDSKYDHPAFELPKNGTRVAQIASFGSLEPTQNAGSPAIAGKITLVNGQILEGITHIIVCTGYHFSYPFFSTSTYHRDDLRREEANDIVLVTDGTMTHNLHQDIFYIPDPTLAFVGVPFRIATFSLFEFQAIAVAAVLAGHATLPSKEVMRAEYRTRIKEKGLGKQFHSLMGVDVQYAADLMASVNLGREESQIKTKGYSKEWVEVQSGYITRMKEFGTAHEGQSRL
ncbi:hypothetical protein BJY01DRAFT_237268 [Aspergillus pseudoustus]|uniref:FAD dependent oxidoreductase n=1 Tax=Aspergillus pseudoustus TaxID=1810923 RepID=A0ABR4JG12_9EURO